MYILFVDSPPKLLYTMHSEDKSSNQWGILLDVGSPGPDN